MARAAATNSPAANHRASVSSKIYTRMPPDETFPLDKSG
jgi:hypothetical protein